MITAQISAVSEENTLVHVTCGDYEISLIEQTLEDHSDINIIARGGDVVPSARIMDGMPVFSLYNKAHVARENEVGLQILAQDFAAAIKYATANSASL